MLRLPFELRMAWREIRPASRRFLFMLSAIALGVGAVTGIEGTSRGLERALSRSARELIAADLAIRLQSAPNEAEQRALDALVEQGAFRTRITETLSMAGSAGSPQPILANIKAVEPEHYPFYGTVELEPQTPLREALYDDTAVASQELLTRTGARIGDRVSIGAAQFRIAAILRGEPDRIASGVDLGPRILITRGGLERARLIQFGSRATESFLYLLPERGLTLDTARRILTAGIQRSPRLTDYREPNPGLRRGIQQMTRFLTLVGLLALLLGGLGVATTLDAYLKTKLDSIAVVKCLGGRSSQIFRIYLVQGLVLGTLGSLAGVGLGYLVQLVAPRFLRGLVYLPAHVELAPGAALEGFLIGIATTLLFLVPPLLAIRKVRPGRVFLREMPETRVRILDRVRRDPLPLVTALALVAGIGALASWLAGSWQGGFGFVGGLAGATAILAAAARLLVAALGRLPRPRSLALRHGLKNLRRPGNQTSAVLVSLGIGVGFVATIYMIQSSLLAQIVRSAPSSYPNVFLLGVTEPDRDALWRLLRETPGVIDAGAPIPAIPSRLERVDGRALPELGLDRDGRRYFQTEFVLTWSASLPPDTRLVRGEWWRAPYGEPMVSIGESAARNLKIGIGSTLEFRSSGKVLRARVTSVRDIEFSRPGNNNQFIFSPGALDGLPASYYGTVRVEAAQVARVQSALFASFPNVTSIDVGQVLVRVQDLIDRIANGIRFIALFAITAGVAMLASSVMSTRYQRIREGVVLRTLGATRAQIGRIHTAEFAVIGLVAGLIGCLLAAAAADYLLGTLLDTEFSFPWLPVLLGPVLTAALAIATGRLAGRGILTHKPLAVLREQ